MFALRIWVLALVLPSVLAAAEPEDRGHQFLGLTNFANFSRASITNGETLTSAEIAALHPWNELILSWNAETPEAAYLKLEVRANGEKESTPWYVMGLWSANPEKFPRESVLGQKDDYGKVDTDTLVLRKRHHRFQIRLTMGGEDGARPRLAFLGICLTDNTVKAPPLDPDKLAWGETLPVPEKSQMAYEGGNVLCSPTTVSMMLGFWSAKLERPDLTRDVPEIKAATFDRNWNGTGNWVFNTAYAGSFPGVRAYTTRLSDVTELERWVNAGMPVGLSLCYDLLRGRESRRSGHLVVCVGFTEEGDPVINDPGTRRNVRKVFKRENLVKAWAYSQNAVYLIYSDRAQVPLDPFGHWDSPAGAARFTFRGADEARNDSSSRLSKDNSGNR
jgi:hypothetical protein